MSERAHYSVAELLDLAHSPLVASPAGFTGINPEWLEAGRWKPRSDRKEHPNRNARRRERTGERTGERNDERHGDRHSDYHHNHRNERGDMRKTEPHEEDDNAPEPAWDDVSEPWVPETDTGNIKEFELWKQRKRQAALFDAGFQEESPASRPEPMAAGESADFNDIAEHAGHTEHTEHTEHAEPVDKDGRKLDVWDSSNIQFKTGGSSRFLFAGGANRSTPPQPVASRGATPDTHNDEFFNSLLNKGPNSSSRASNPSASAPPPGLTRAPPPSGPPGLAAQPSGNSHSGVPPGLQPNHQAHQQHPPPPPGLALHGYPSQPPGLQTQSPNRQTQPPPHMMQAYPPGFGYPPGQAPAPYPYYPPGMDPSRYSYGPPPGL